MGGIFERLIGHTFQNIEHRMKRSHRRGKVKWAGQGRPALPGMGFGSSSSDL